MRTIDISGKHLAWRALAVVAAAAALTLLLADVGAAKWKKGTYTGQTTAPQHNAVQLDVKKKQVTVVFFDFYTGCGVPMCEPSYAGLTGKIKKKGKKGKFDVPGPDGIGYVRGSVKGKRAHGTAAHGTGDPELPSLPINWEAKRTGPSFFSD